MLCFSQRQYESHIRGAKFFKKIKKNSVYLRVLCGKNTKKNLRRCCKKTLKGEAHQPSIINLVKN